MIPAELGKQLEAVARELPRGLAAFDADGTLWREDVGEAFLRHLVSLGWVTLPDGSDPYEAYERAVDRDKKTGYAYAAQLMAGLAKEAVAAEAVFFATEWVPKRIVADTAGLIELCKKAGLRPVVISASALPIVLAAAAVSGFAAADCRGIETVVREGKYTDALVEPVTYAQGKVECAASLGPLALACGDSLLGDLPMLEAAKIAVAVAPRGGSPLSIEAHRRKWPVLNQDD